MATPQNFRSAFNGFNRDDVVNYISYLTTKHDNQLNQLHTEMEELRRELAERAAVPAVDETEINALQDLVEHLQSELEQRDETIARLQAAAEASAAPVAPAAPVVPAVPAAPSFAEQELSAYRRAESAERRAMERVNQLYAKANGVLADTVIRMDTDAELVAQMAEQVRAGLETLELAVLQSKTALVDSSAVLRSMQLNGEE